MSHTDLLPQDAGGGLQLTSAAVRDPVAATHGAVDSRARLLAHALSSPVLHGTHRPEQALHPEARGRGLVCGGHGSSAGQATPRRTHKPQLHAAGPLLGWGWSRKSGPEKGRMHRARQRKGQTRGGRGRGRPRRPQPPAGARRGAAPRQGFLTAHPGQAPDQQPRGACACVGHPLCGKEESAPARPRAAQGRRCLSTCSEDYKARQQRATPPPRWGQTSGCGLLAAGAARHPARRSGWKTQEAQPRGKEGQRGHRRRDARTQGQRWRRAGHSGPTLRWPLKAQRAAASRDPEGCRSRTGPASASLPRALRAPPMDPTAQSPLTGESPAKPPG